MKNALMILWILLCLVVVAAGYIRLAPSNPDQWHRTLDFSGDRDLTGGVQRLLPGDAAALERLDTIIRATPRTELLAGSLADGHLTYITRSRVVGFPDYATVQASDGQIRIHSRLRFGRSDLGVNKARVDGWLQALTSGQPG